VLDIFRNEAVYTAFSAMPKQEQSAIVENILAQKTDSLQLKKLEHYLKLLAK
jgi:hypothetical protein